MPDVFQYLDFRAYLRDYYQEKKASQKAFSHLSFARKAGIASSGFLLHVMKGERNLTRPVALKTANAMGLGKTEKEYFGWLVDYGQAKGPSEKNLAYEKIMSMRHTAKVRQLDDGQYAFYSASLHAVLRELAPLAPAGFPAARLAKLVVPPPSAAETSASLKLLQELGLLYRETDRESAVAGPDGKFVQRDAFIGGTGAPVRKPAITRFQKALLELAGQAWDHFGENEIAMRTATLALSEAGAAAVKAELKACVERILELAQGDAAPADRIFHVNLNFFPATKSLKGLRS
jgi:uncharacterized protein (TIGR02147 family)